MRKPGTIVCLPVCLILIAIVCAASSCLKDEDPAIVTLTVDWANRTDGADTPSSYHVVIGGQTVTYHEASNRLPELVAGTYPVSIYNPAEKIAIEGTQATVATTNGIIDPQPGWLFYAGLDITCENNKEIAVTATMQQQIRLLHLELAITEGDPDAIESVTASLSGVGNSLDLQTGTPSGAGLKVIPEFTRKENKLTASVRLIGLTTEAQKLTLDITYKGGTHQQIVSDISNELTGFSADKHKPVTLHGNASILSRVDYETTITAWETQISIESNVDEQ